MDIEKLTKHQIVLLTLLVSFVTSIATGVVTVSLMDQAPPEVSRTINQIVEHTIEKVVPAEVPAAVAAKPAPSVTTKETTVVVKDDDLVGESIAKVQRGMVRIVSLNDPDTLVARGVMIDAAGTVLSDRGSLEPMGTLSFAAYLPDGTRVPALMRTPVGTTSLAILDLKLATSSSIAPVALADPAKLHLGQTVVRIGGSGADTVGAGVLARLSDAHRDLIEASVVSSTPGSVLLNIFGEVIGIVTSDSLAMGADFYTLAKQ
jgi:S1-C subfamily serine protease